MCKAWQGKMTTSVKGEIWVAVLREELRKVRRGYERFVPGETESIVPLGMQRKRTDDIKP